MKELTIEEKARRFDEAINIAKSKIKNDKDHVLYEEDIIDIFPELKVSKDERIRKVLVDYFKRYKGQEERGGSTMFCGIPTDDILTWLEKQYKKELVNFDEAEKEKSDFVGGGFIKCFRNFLDFKKFETYWLEYIGDDNYNVRSDNLLGKTYHITPYQLYTIFRKQTGFKKRGESAEINPDEIIEECYQDNADHIIDIVTEQEKPSEWSGEDEKIMSTIMEEGELKPSERHWLKSLKERVRLKQGEQTSLQTNERAWLYLVADVLTWKDGIGQYLDDPRVQELAKKLRSEYAQKLYNSVRDAPNEQKSIEVKGKSVLEAVKEEKVDNDIKAEPNLKVDDYVVRKDGKNFHDNRNFARITKIDGIMCQFDNGCWLYDYEIRAWSIYDAKDGDILASAENKPFIYNGRFNDTNIGAYCGFNIINAFTIGNKQCDWTKNENIRPATKKECQSLFAEMNLLGWVWNPETKVLNLLRNV